MAQDENFAAGSNSAGDARSKKPKPNKIPQRGLGVAQLEKLRVEEQRKEALQLLAADASAGDSIPDPVQGPNPIPGPISHGTNKEESGDLARLWTNNGFGLDFVHPRQFHNVDHRQWRPNGPGFPVTGGVPQFLKPPSSVNILRISPPVSGFRSEPPSIQSVLSHTPSSSEDDKIVGTKRPYPFSLGSPPLPSPQTHFHPGNFYPRSRSADERSRSADEFPSYSKKYIIRDGPSNSTPLPELEDVMLTRDFLTLAPPLPLSSDNHHVEISESKEQHLFSFFPTKLETDQTSDDGNGEREETVDLNLKL